MNNIQIPPIVKNLLIINGIFFLAKYFFGNQLNMDDLLGAHYFASPKFRIWQPITYMFMHANLMHLFFNMFGLFMFGGVLEHRWGQKRFLNFYLITGLGALFLQWAVQAFELYQISGSIMHPGNIDIAALAQGQFNPSMLSEATASKLYGIFFGTMVGASGAVFGVMTAFGVLYPNVELMLMFIPVPIKAKYFIPFYIVVELFLGVVQISGDSVAHFAHLGGALIGFILVKLWNKKDRFYDYYE